jgi:hypothetical protein
LFSSGAGTKPATPADYSVAPIKINSSKSLFTQAFAVLSYTKK